ncbi:hypothetical protein N658DRAFT_33192 [Parathielavia hyrcaniae]|uniref:Uncharacterized protein n=1 Tax=Parathielavia hyrcaniae TaxID=113614 RepID=A0AAN6T794_9PEZI|nr:hypothetical protein N658DRAFT_33192 [Parathielavia hyrcaniae]
MRCHPLVHQSRLLWRSRVPFKMTGLEPESAREIRRHPSPCIAATLTCRIYAAYPLSSGSKFKAVSHACHESLCLIPCGAIIATPNPSGSSRIYEMKRESRESNKPSIPNRPQPRQTPRTLDHGGGSASVSTTARRRGPATAPKPFRPPQHAKRPQHHTMIVGIGRRGEK